METLSAARVIRMVEILSECIAVADRTRPMLVHAGFTPEAIEAASATGRLIYVRDTLLRLSCQPIAVAPVPGKEIA